MRIICGTTEHHAYNSIKRCAALAIIMHTTDKIPDWAIRTESDKEAIEQGCFWSQQQASRILAFTYKHFRSQFIKGKLQLVEAQERLLQQIYGWRLPNGDRRFRLINLHAPKKSFAKTLLICILAHYELFASGEPSPIVVSAAASQRNASLVYQELKYSIERSAFKQFTRRKDHTKEVICDSLNARFQSIPDAGRANHGDNISVGLIDEAAWTKANAQTYESMRYAIQARPNGMIVVISTSSDQQEHWYNKRIYSKSKRIISGEEIDITHLGIVYEMDRDGNPEDPEQWQKANPLLGQHWCPLDRFKRELEAAKQSGIGEWINFQRLMLGRWLQAEELAFFDVSTWDELKATPTDDELHEAPAYLGIDLSQITDPSSVSILFDLGEGKYHCRSTAFISEAGVTNRSKKNEKPFTEYIEQGDMKETPGEIISKHEIMNHIVELTKKYNVQKLLFDTASSWLLADELEAETGITCERVPPSARYYNAPMNELLLAVREKRFTHEGNNWLRYCFENVRIQVNTYNEVYPYKKKSRDVIDGAISTLLALYGVMSKENAGAGFIEW